MHKNNKHSQGYQFEALTERFQVLKPFVFENTYGNKTIDFANPEAVKALNTALLKHHYNIDYWEFPNQHLCPPIPGRVDYIHVVNELLQTCGLKNNIKVLDIGTGATCIYPLLGNAAYDWNFIASEVDKDALKNAQNIISKNNLEAHIELRFQNDSNAILNGILNSSERISASMCNPPFYKNEMEALENTKRKLKGLGKSSEALVRNFSGTPKELWYPGGEKAFLHNYLYQSSQLKTNCFWYTSLVSKKEHVRSMQTSLKKLGATSIKVIPMSLGHKKSRVVAWTFLSDDEQQDWIS